MSDMISIPLDELIDFIRSKRVSITSNPATTKKKLLLPAKQSMQIPLTKRSVGNIDLSELLLKPLRSGH